MRGKESGIYCSVEEAAVVLGLRPVEVRSRMQDGTLNIGTCGKKNRYVTYRVRRDLVAKEAGLNEFPASIITETKNHRAEYAALMMKKEGIDAVKIADILLEAEIITPKQREKMAEVM